MALSLSGEIVKRIFDHYSGSDIRIVDPFHIGGAETLMFWIRAGYEAERPRHGLGLGKSQEPIQPGPI
jgi:hypothetical protein